MEGIGFKYRSSGVADAVSTNAHIPQAPPIPIYSRDSLDFTVQAPATLCLDFASSCRDIFQPACMAGWECQGVSISLCTHAWELEYKYLSSLQLWAMSYFSGSQSVFQHPLKNPKILLGGLGDLNYFELVSRYYPPLLLWFFSQGYKWGFPGVIMLLLWWLTGWNVAPVVANRI